MRHLWAKSHSRFFIKRLAYHGQTSFEECMGLLRQKRSKTMMTDGEYDAGESHAIKLNAVVKHFLGLNAIEPVQTALDQERAFKLFVVGDLDDEDPALNEAFNRIVFRFTERGRNLYHAKRLMHLYGVDL